MPRRRLRPESVYRPVVWIVGASRGIGAETAVQFSSVGCTVCLSSRSTVRLAAVKNRIEQLGGEAEVFPCDVTRPASIDKAFTRIRRRYGAVDVLINTAGVTIFRDFLHTSVRTTEEILRTNLHGPLHCVRCVLPSMVARRRGWIINVASNAAVKTFEDSAVYTSTKAGLLGFSRVLREETRKYRIRVVSIIPGPVETGMWSRNDRKRYRHRMMSAKGVAESILAVYQTPPDVVVDEIHLRPMMGDID